MRLRSLRSLWCYDQAANYVCYACDEDICGLLADG